MRGAGFYCKADFSKTALAVSLVKLYAVIFKSNPALYSF